MEPGAISEPAHFNWKDEDDSMYRVYGILYCFRNNEQIITDSFFHLLQASYYPIKKIVCNSAPWYENLQGFKLSKFLIRYEQ